MVGKTGKKRLTLAKGLRFTCRQCGDCCRDTSISLTAEEVERFKDRDWADVIGAPGPVTHTVRSGGKVTTYLRHRKDGSCVFLDEASLCRIHSQLGESDKPLACRSYPFQFVAGAPGRRAVATASFTCSAIAAGDGERLSDRRQELEAGYAEVEGLGLVPARELPYLGVVGYPRADLEEVFELMVHEVEDAGRPFPQRILALAKFVTLFTNSAFGSLSGNNTRKQVASFMKGIRSQIERGLIPFPADRPPLPQRLLFRLLLGMAARRDPARLQTAGFIRRSVRRFGNLLAGLTFMVGNGIVQPVGRDRRVALGEVRRLAPPADPLDPIADGALTRYFVAKLSGRFPYDPDLQMRALLPSLGLLLRQYPMILLFARAACHARGGDSLTREDYASALRTADHNFGRIAWDAGLIGGVRARLLSDVESAFGFLGWCALRPTTASSSPSTPEPPPPQLPAP